MDILPIELKLKIIIEFIKNQDINSLLVLADTSKIFREIISRELSRDFIRIMKITPIKNNKYFELKANARVSVEFYVGRDLHIFIIAPIIPKQFRTYQNLQSNFLNEEIKTFIKEYYLFIKKSDNSTKLFINRIMIHPQTQEEDYINYIRELDVRYLKHIAMI
jgi:hypothetical protein